MAREQMKDILITLQQAVISHLREVFMDEAALKLHALKETSDDCRVNATVCLGQLYQRMSTATAAMNQILRPYIHESNKDQLPASLAYSSSRSTHSSFGGGPFDNQSASSYTTYSPRTAIGHDYNPSGELTGGLAPQRRISMNSAYSYTGKQPKVRTPGEDNVPALPFPKQRQTSQGPVETLTNGANPFQQAEHRVPLLNAEPPPYKRDLYMQVYTTDDKGQRFPPESSFYQPHTVEVHQQPPQSPPQRSPRLAGEINFSRPSPPSQDHELHNRHPHWRQEADQEPAVQSFSTQRPSLSQHQAVPLNPDYSTLEFVPILDSRSRSPPFASPDTQYQHFLEQLPPQLQQQVRQSMPYGYQHQQISEGQSAMNSPISRPQTSTTDSGIAPIDPLFQQRVSTISRGSSGR